VEYSSEALNVFCLEDGTALQNEENTLRDVFDAQQQVLAQNAIIIIYCTDSQ